MRKFTKIIALLLALSMLIAMTACAKGGDTGTTGTTTGTTNNNTNTNTTAPADDKPKEVKLDNPNLYLWGTLSEDKPDDTFSKTVKAFEEKFGGKVELENVPWAERTAKLIATSSAGAAPDMVMANHQHMPAYAMKGLLQPLDTFEGYLDPKDPMWDKDLTKTFGWNGKPYILGVSTNPIVVYYNKTMIENNGLEDPNDVYNRGDWTWDTFKQYAKDLTVDKDNDGNIDVWGVTSYYYPAFINTNEGEFAVTTDDGNIDIRWDMPETIEALEFLRNGWVVEKWYRPAHGTADWVDGNLAMVVEQFPGFAEGKAVNQKDEWDIVPMPKAPRGDGSKTPATTFGNGVSTASANPKGGATFLTMLGQTESTHERVEYKVDKKYYDLAKKLSENVYPLLDCSAIGDWRNKQWPFWNDLKAGETVASTIEKHKPVFQNEIKNAIADVGIPTIEPFNNVAIDFEDGKMELLSSNGLTAKAEITEDANEAIKGKSLKLTGEEGVMGDQILIATNLDTVKITPYHKYTITFDYKVVGDSQDPKKGKYFAAFRLEDPNSNANQQGNTVIKASKVGDSGTFTKSIVIEKNFQNLMLVVGGTAAGSIVIDNLTIVADY